MNVKQRHMGVPGMWQGERPLRGDDLICAQPPMEDDEEGAAPPTKNRPTYYSPYLSAVLGNPFISHLRTEERSQLLEAGQWANFKPDEVLCQQAKPVVAVIFLAFGTARAEVCIPVNGTFKLMASFLGPGDDIGLFSLLDGAPNQATVTVQEEMYALVVPVAAFGNWLQKYPELYRILANLMAERLRLRGLYLQSLI